MLVDIGAFGQCAGYFYRGGTGFDRQGVVGQFYGVDAAETAPEQVVPAVLAKLYGVDAVLNAYFVAYKQLAEVGEGACRRVGHCRANAAFPFAAPARLTVVEYIAAIDILYVRCPDIAVGYHLRACFVGESGADKFPVDQIVRFEYGQVGYVFGCIKIIVAVGGTQHGGVGGAYI